MSANGFSSGRWIADKYQIERELAQGGMGRVYIATQHPIKRKIVLKIMHAELVSQPELRERFLQEARTAGRLSHPNTVVIFDYGSTSENLCFLAMEYIEGESLQERVRRLGPLPLEESISICNQAASSLAEAHRRQIVHRDLKPENIMVQPGPNGQGVFVKVLDFGIAKLLDQNRNLTMKGTVVGTPEFMAPEQAADEPLDGRADLYALGCCLYYMLVGVPPFLKATPYATMLAQINDPIPALPTGLPSSLNIFLRRALAKYRDDRPADAGAFIAEMRHALEGAGLSGAISAVHTKPHQKRLPGRSGTGEAMRIDVHALQPFLFKGEVPEEEKAPSGPISAVNPKPGRPMLKTGEAVRIDLDAMQPFLFGEEPVDEAVSLEEKTADDDAVSEGGDEDGTDQTIKMDRDAFESLHGPSVPSDPLVTPLPLARTMASEVIPAGVKARSPDDSNDPESIGLMTTMTSSARGSSPPNPEPVRVTRPVPTQPAASPTIIEVGSQSHATMPWIIIAVLTLVALGGLVAVFMDGDDDPPEEQTRTTRSSEETRLEADAVMVEGVEMIQLNITSAPIGAIVYIDGEAVSATPFDLVRAKGETVEVMLKSDAFVDHDFGRITLDEATSDLFAKLERRRLVVQVISPLERGQLYINDVFIGALVEGRPLREEINWPARSLRLSLRSETHEEYVLSVSPQSLSKALSDHEDALFEWGPDLEDLIARPPPTPSPGADGTPSPAADVAPSP